MLGLLDKHCKSNIINRLKELKESSKELFNHAEDTIDKPSVPIDWFINSRIL